MNTQQCYELILSDLLGRTVIIEHRTGYGWFVTDNGRTLFGFQSLLLLGKYVENAVERGFLYIPSARETYGQ